MNGPIEQSARFKSMDRWSDLRVHVHGGGDQQIFVTLDASGFVTVNETAIVPLAPGQARALAQWLLSVVPNE